MLYLVLALLLGLQPYLTQSQNITCNPNDLKALQDFVNNLTPPNLPSWPLNSSIQSNCCNWYGINCSTSSRVTHLVLPNLKLTGKISDSLTNLDNLRVLNLSKNFFRDSLPVSFFNFSKLESLDLSENDFSGVVTDFVNLESLLELDLSSNSFNGTIPVGLCLFSSRIRSVELSDNEFSGRVLPGFSNCSELEYLWLGLNGLSGEIDEDMFRVRGLKTLGLQGNGLSGQLSGSIANLVQLERLDLSANKLSGVIPDVFGNLVRLRSFLGHSNGFVGSIPKSLANLGSLNKLNVRNNSLSGSIDLNCSALNNLTSLDLATNKFSGPVPEYLPQCKSLQLLNLARINFSGQVPETFKNFERLSYLSMSNSSISNITGALNTLQQIKTLTSLVLTLNFRDEVLSEDLSLRFDSLKVLVIANCRLRGSLPQWLTHSKRLQVLDLSWNHLNGVIPSSWIGGFEDLFYLDLGNNSFTGEIPRSLTTLTSLISRNIMEEEPMPDFPFFMRNNGTARNGLLYNQIWRFPPTIDLSHNLLTGPIWPEFGNLKKLHNLDLKYNNLSGTIPSELSMMTSLETLDLSRNNLSGRIPFTLVNLSFLSVFDVSYNGLEGTIPSGGQFPTFPNSSFEGTYLCGEHGRPSCTKDTLDAPSKSRVNRDAIVGMAIGIVFGTVFILFLMFMIVKRTRNQGVEVDPEKQGVDTNETDWTGLGSSSVVLFNTQENFKDVSMEELLKSTNNFDQAYIVGCGGFGLVYKATLPDGRTVAIKRLSGDCGQMDREFRAEVEALSRAQHSNLVHLQGYCTFRDDRLLIYSYMENGSLDYWLHEKIDGPPQLDWETRLRIAQGAARGLAYLHLSCEPHILHRDVKSSNILLDENFEAHLADFGLARLILPYDTHVTTDLVGTLGYIPPEYGQASVATYKGDVYSFGVVLLELLTGKRPMDICKPKDARDLISWVKKMKKENRESEIIDPFIYDKEHDKELLRTVEIACLCLKESPKERPLTQQLVSWLENLHNK